jgi:hypothetical protein
MSLRNGNDVRGDGITVNHDLLLTTLEIALEQKRETIRILMAEAHALYDGLLASRWRDIDRHTTEARNMAEFIYTLRSMNTDKRVKGFKWIDIRGMEGDEQ